MVDSTIGESQKHLRDITGSLVIEERCSTRNIGNTTIGNPIPRSGRSIVTTDSRGSGGRRLLALQASGIVWGRGTILSRNDRVGSGTVSPPEIHGSVNGSKVSSEVEVNTSSPVEPRHTNVDTSRGNGQGV
jgi:hypothetical protein